MLPLIGETISPLIQRAECLISIAEIRLNKITIENRQARQDGDSDYQDILRTMRVHESTERQCLIQYIADLDAWQDCETVDDARELIAEYTERLEQAKSMVDRELHDHHDKARYISLAAFYEKHIPVLLEAVKRLE